MGRDDDPDAVLPLLFEIKLKLSIQHKCCSVKLRAPGTISAEFDRTKLGEIGTGLKSVDVRLDTGVLLESMVKEARMVVFNAVRKRPLPETARVPITPRPCLVLRVQP